MASYGPLPDEQPSFETRPAIYYGEGSFDAPSSDDEDERLLEKNGPATPTAAERGDWDGLVVGGHSKKRRLTSLRALLFAIASLVVLAILIGTFAAIGYKGGTTYKLPGAKKLTMDDIYNGTFYPERVSLHWIPEAGDGVYSVHQDGYIRLVDLKSNKTQDLLPTSDVTNENGDVFFWDEWKLSADMKYLLVKTDRTKLWRWSSFGNYYIHDIETRQTRPLLPRSLPPVIAYATWSPTGQAIAYVANNDLYILPSLSSSAKPIRVTDTGNTTVSNGVPPWVYEEEIFSAPYTLWFSPDSKKVAFLSFDETDVPEYTFPIYNPTDDGDTIVPYPTEVRVRYPKAGFNNPKVRVRVFDIEGYTGDAEDAIVELEWPGRINAADRVLLEVQWAGAETLVVKEVNRNADAGSVVVFELPEGVAAAALNDGGLVMGAIVRKLGKEGEEGDDGYIENAQTIYPLPAAWSGASSGYLDIVPTKEGFNHIALFTPANSSTPQFLTSGEWEVTDGIKAIDENGTVYFAAANPSSVQRHIYSVKIPKGNETASSPIALTDVETAGYWDASFSPEGGFYVLSYQGPGIPHQSVLSTTQPEFERILTLNEQLSNATELYEAAVKTHTTIESDGYELNVMEIRPPRMDDSGRTKYPVLFRVYGGPQSQLVNLRFNRDWDDYLACALGYIVVIVDGRGTGFKGRKLRNVVKGNLGYWETKDQIEAARLWASKEYVDPKRIGIWGWSYGGFMSAKVVEADAGIHSLAISVAPVTSWRLYDSIYTERYMNTPELNPGGYVNASISNVAGFHHVDYLLAHGSADDNVHFQNTAHLLDMFTKAKVRNFRFRMFTDSDHSINRRGGHRELYEYMIEFLVEKWGKGGRRRGW